MLEESRMDKKSSNRSSQPQSRASAIDCKKNTELTHKPWPRNNKKREGPSGAPKNEPYRKNVPAQRGRGAVDRRPRARGPTGFNVGGTQNTGIEDDNEPEIGSVFVPGSKKQNLNHLLNFMYPTRGGAERRGPQPQGRRPTQRERVVIRHEHDLYLRAYCQFVMKKGWDYNVNLLDPDIPVKWDQIEEIVVRSTGKSECPICLGTPVAGRVGLCGHVYCWPCVLHYAAAHDKQPPPCPVCTTPLHVKDMKPTRMVQWESPAEEVTMRLVRRLRGSTTVEIAPPRGQLDQPPAEPVQPLENINSAPYSKFFTATKQQVHEILERERKEIQNQIFAEIDTTEIVFMEQVLEMLNNKEKYMDTEIDEPVEIETPDVSTTPIVYEKQEVNEKRMDWFDVTEDGAASMDVLQDQMAELDIAVDSNLNPEAPTFVGDFNDNQPEEFPLIDYSGPPDEEEAIDDNPTVTDEDKQNQAKYFYFYQAEDGQQVFLNSLNVRILNASWGALAAAPPIIRGRVLHRETLPLTDQTRKHMPHTAHLPLYCSFDIVEMDLQPPYVTTTALKCFSEELERRARIRARHERDERRRERALRRAMEGPPKPDFSSDLVFPPAALSPPDPPLAMPLEEASSTASAASPPTAGPSFAKLVFPPAALSPPDPPLATSLGEASPTASAASPTAGPSFAKMASTSGTWRVRKVAEAPPPPPADPNAPRALCLSDAIEAALHRAPSATPANGKKKKNKQKVLFATGMQRAG